MVLLLPEISKVTPAHTQRASPELEWTPYIVVIKEVPGTDCGLQFDCETSQPENRIALEQSINFFIDLNFVSQIKNIFQAFYSFSKI